jgi:hypothetical protein
MVIIIKPHPAVLSRLKNKLKALTGREQTPLQKGALMLMAFLRATSFWFVDMLAAKILGWHWKALNFVNALIIIKVETTVFQITDVLVPPTGD